MKKSTLFDSPIFLALLVGTYIASFYISNNLTMLPLSSAILLIMVLIMPLLIVVFFFHMVIGRSGRQQLSKTVSVFLSISYLLVMFRLPMLEIDSINNVFDGIGDFTGLKSNFIFVGLTFFVAALGSFLFHRNIVILTVALSVMTIAAIVPKLFFTSFSDVQTKTNFDDGYLEINENIILKNAPNIYFILADAYSSFTYLEQNEIDVSNLSKFLSGNGFRLYKDVFSNYQPTTSAMPAMLNMQHHYYELSEDLLDPFALSQQFSEVSRSGRIISAGKNNLTRLLKQNNYESHYIHERKYLMFHGCSADYCYPEVSPLDGAESIINRIIPAALNRQTRPNDSEVLSEVQQIAIGLVEQSRSKGQQIFQYIHIFHPGHSPNERQGSCNEVEEIQNYSQRIEVINKYIIGLIAEIVEKDPSAVIVLTSDHGPFISQRCAQRADLFSAMDYRDRAGVVLGIRWPEGYAGQYDLRIRTTINLFKYLLASLVDDDSYILDTLEPDDVYIRGANNVQRIIAEGEVLIPPENISRKELEALFSSKSVN